MMTDNGRLVRVPDWLEPTLTSLVETTRERMETAHGPATLVLLSRLAHEAYEFGRAAAISELLTTEQAASVLGVDESRIRQLAKARGVGWRTGRDWLFRPSDIDAMRVRRPGRPRAG